MNYLIKCAVQHVLSNIPKGERINLWLQINGMKNLPVSETEYKNKTDIAKKHIEYYKKFNLEGNQDISKITSFEFGAGFDLIAPLLFSHYGLKDIYCVDIEDKSSVFLVDNILKRFSKDKDISRMNLINYEGTEFLNKEFKSVLKDKYSIHYKAPMDAAKTNFENNSIDLISTNATFEHIPKNDIVRILKEAYRVLKPGGVFSNAIDYKDHWAYTDNRLSFYNFLKHSDKKWKYFNPALNYQNRLRHKEHIELFESAGFKVKLNLPELPSEKDKVDLSKLEINEYYKNNFTFEELSVLSSFIVLTK